MNQKKLESLRPTYAEIDLQAFKYNLEQAKKLSGTDLIAVIKANGYGHGAVKLAEFAWEKCDIKRFGVATLLEAIELRVNLSTQAAIYVLGYVDEEFYAEAVENNLVLTMFDDEIASNYNTFLEKNNKKADVSLKIDTGMHRLGFSPELSYYEFTVKYPRLNVCHVMTHLAGADTHPEYTQQQKDLFNEFLERNNIRCHTSMLGSAGIYGVDNICTLSRPGIMLYGYIDGNNEVALKKVMRIYSKVVHIKHLLKGESVSYCRNFIADKDMIIGVVPIGYADGYRRAFSSKAKMRVLGVDCAVLGNVCMDMTMIDLSHVNITEPHPVVEVMGDNISAEYLAGLADTITYEILCGISSRVPRIYLEQ
jgi:alanine racemase